MLYVNPELSNRDCGLFRIGGPGLANCMFFAARAAILADRIGGALLRPTWERIGIGQFIRRENDKRHYAGLFKGGGFAQGLKKLFILKTRRRIPEESAAPGMDGVVGVGGLAGYFADLWPRADFARSYILSQILPDAISGVPGGLSRAIAVHVRLGDYPKEYRIDVEWYRAVLERLADRAGKQLDIRVFSDGTDEELAGLLSLPGARRTFCGNALADIVAISRCGLVVGSDSTFSGWGTFLGAVPSVFHHLHYGRPLEDASRVFIAPDAGSVPYDDLVRLV